MAKEEVCRQMIMAIGKDGSRDSDFLADDAAGRKPAAIDLRSDFFNHHPVAAICRLHAIHPTDTVLVPVTSAAEMRPGIVQQFNWISWIEAIKIKMQKTDVRATS